MRYRWSRLRGFLREIKAPVPTGVGTGALPVPSRYLPVPYLLARVIYFHTYIYLSGTGAGTYWIVHGWTCPRGAVTGARLPPRLCPPVPIEPNVTIGFCARVTGVFWVGFWRNLAPVASNWPNITR